MFVASSAEISSTTTYLSYQRILFKAVLISILCFMLTVQEMLCLFVAKPQLIFTQLCGSDMF